MAHFVLIHGASHGGWCWRHIVPRLEALGHRAVAVDLPGHAEGEKPHAQVTLSEYRSAALAAAEAETIMVGHSLGGLSITLAAALRPETLKTLVYIAAFVPTPGLRFTDFRKDAVSPELNEITFREGGLSIPIADRAVDVFCHDCSAEDRAYVAARLSPQPIAVMTEVLNFEPPDVPRHYVLCTDDHVVLPAYQREITKGWPAGTVHEMQTGHSPFFSNPDGLTDILHSIATT